MRNKISLRQLRRRIDRIDGEIVRRLTERARVAVRIGREKRKESAPVSDAARERAVLERVRRMNRGPATDRALEAVYRRIIRMCLAVQKGARKR